MLSEKIIREVDRLSVKERVALLEYIARSVHEELESKPRSKSKIMAKTGLPRELEFSRGMLRQAGVPALTDDEADQIVADSLLGDYLSLK